LPHHLLEPGVVRQWVTAMKAKGASARTIEYCKRSILNAIFTTVVLGPLEA
jgi:hypothetical protein